MPKDFLLLTEPSLSEMSSPCDHILGNAEGLTKGATTARTMEETYMERRRLNLATSQSNVLHCGANGSNQPFDEARVQVYYQHAEKRHFFACVLKDNARVVGLAAQTVGGHHHGQVIHIHLCSAHI